MGFNHSKRVEVGCERGASWQRAPRTWGRGLNEVLPRSKELPQAPAYGGVPVVSRSLRRHPFLEVYVVYDEG